MCRVREKLLYCKSIKETIFHRFLIARVHTIDCMKSCYLCQCNFWMHVKQCCVTLEIYIGTVYIILFVLRISRMINAINIIVVVSAWLMMFIENWERFSEHASTSKFSYFKEWEYCQRRKIYVSTALRISLALLWSHFLQDMMPSIYTLLRLLHSTDFSEEKFTLMSF